MLPTRVFDRSNRVRFEFSGPTAAQTLDGLVSNEVQSLTDGRGVYAGALTAKGKIIADVRIFRRGDVILVDTSPAAGAGLRDMFTKYVNPRFAKYTDVTDSLLDLAVAGHHAYTLLAHALDVDAAQLAALPPFGHTTVSFQGEPVMIVHTPEVRGSAYDLVAPVSMRDALTNALTQAGATPGDADEWEMRRIEIGWPAWGVDMTDVTLPQEANFDELSALSYTKGCYIGQEPVARIHFRGHVNRFLRRLAFDTEAKIPTGATLTSGDGTEVGDVRSVTQSPSYGVIGIGMVRREVDDGHMLTATWDGGSAAVQVTGKAKGAIG